MSDDSLDALLPAGWAAQIPEITGQVRHLLSVLGGLGFAWAYGVTGSEVQMAVTMAMMLAGPAWSWWQKRQAKKALAIAANNPKGAPAPKLPA